MSSDTHAISVENVTKVYRIYGRPHHRILQSINRKGKYFRDFLALDSVSLHVKKGETVGIVGRNGSGKSTLLQIICGVLPQTSGNVWVNGRVAAILELGAGFNPEFSGRENALLGATLLGMTEVEARAKLGEIVKFAELEEFIDQPVKTYSSGMYIRLAFSLAISVAPDILVVDEALAVGDEAFQRKCFSKIEELKAGGCTLLFVSHSAGSITHLCDRAILLDGGKKLLSGAPKKIIAYYQKLIYASGQKRQEVLNEIALLDSLDEYDEIDIQEDLGPLGQPRIQVFENFSSERFEPGLQSSSMVELVSNGVEVSQVKIKNVEGQEVNVLSPGGEYRLTYTASFFRQARHVNLGMMIKSIDGIELFGMTSNAVGDGLEFVAKGVECYIEFKFRNLFLPGTYFVNVGCHGTDEAGEHGFLYRVLDVIMFKVEATASNRLVRGFYDLSEEPACSLHFHAMSKELPSIP